MSHALEQAIQGFQSVALGPLGLTDLSAERLQIAIELGIDCGDRGLEFGRQGIRRGPSARRPRSVPFTVPGSTVSLALFKETTLPKEVSKFSLGTLGEVRFNSLTVQDSASTIAMASSNLV